jgi:hypothetical protein
VIGENKKINHLEIVCAMCVCVKHSYEDDYYF